jgi:RNA polymerase sigma factor (TIGR02999 family)
MADDRHRATRALVAHVGGDTEAASELLPLVYDRLRSLAARYMRHERPEHTLQPTALVHEAYVRLIDGAHMNWEGKTHFFAMAATQMRRILIEHARARAATKRGGGATRVDLSASGFAAPGDFVDMLAIDEALERLARESPRQSRVVELRFFGGLSVEETARLLDVSGATVKGDWRVAKAWLARELSVS